MGWKSFKEHFKIEHTVHVTSDGLCIGSSYVHDLVVIDIETGKILKDGIGGGFFREYYPDILNISDAERLSIIKSPDLFGDCVNVYWFEDYEIKEDQCEKFGWPNVTCGGVLMYRNTHFRTDQEAYDYGIKDFESEIKWFTKNVNDKKEEVVRLENSLTRSSERLEEFRKHGVTCE